MQAISGQKSMDNNAFILKKLGLPEDHDPVDSPIVLSSVTRKDLAGLFAELGYKTGVEIGVERGKYSSNLLSLNPDLKLYCVDAWESYHHYREHLTEQDTEQLFKDCQHRLEVFGTRVQLIRKYSMDAVKDFAEGSLDFCYIDGNHSFDFVMQDIIEWSKRVRVGGIVSGHDYTQKAHEKVQVVEAVQAYTKCHRIDPWFIAYEDNKQPPTYFWVKT